MDATALSLAGPAIQIHAGSAIFALVLGTIVLLLKKGTRLHKAMGRVWIATMVVVALSSFLITEVRMFGPYSWIHILSLYTLFGVAQGVWFIRRGNVRAHRGQMIGLYVGALILAGSFTLLPGRRMHDVVFADGGQTAALVATGVAALIAVTMIVGRRMRRSTV
ncbi:DUF2306 domain-containing protein [Pelagibacterium luteolum]|uniref:Uncharacterized membrane protein n=1 Tax=Pelagibacterium luteolum TaxID=440168 RepID=A0A1G7VBV4_9HYPH|nr:DUF2306 domain-containing protein [Pelagibacterium luteolum]SDG57302.1 Uncharacterized membrane protein [Pelagibacterium luteolum]